MRSRLASLALAALVCAACSGRPNRPDGPAWQLPGSYRANQVVHVTTPEGTLDFLASVVRREGDVEVVLFDPALQVPLLRATSGPGGIAETAFVDGVPPGNGRRLVELIQTMNGLRFLPEGPAVRGATGSGWHFTLTGSVGGPSCEFPGRISVEHRLGGPRIEVETTEVDCGAPAP